MTAAQPPLDCCDSSQLSSGRSGHLLSRLEAIPEARFLPKGRSSSPWLSNGGWRSSPALRSDSGRPVHSKREAVLTLHSKAAKNRSSPKAAAPRSFVEVVPNLQPVRSKPPHRLHETLRRVRLEPSRTAPLVVTSLLHQSVFDWVLIHIAKSGQIRSLMRDVGFPEVHPHPAPGGFRKPIHLDSGAPV
jgi:hypothetical protein